MLKVSNNLISVSILDLLNALKVDLNSQGIQKLHTIKPLGDNIQVTCPNIEHKGGNESKASCGILTIDKGKHLTGTAHCFTCGYRLNFAEFVSMCFNINDGGQFGQSWLLSILRESGHYTRSIQQLQREFTNQSVNYVTEQELEVYRFTHPYMYERGLTDEIIEKFDVGYDQQTNCLTFPVWDSVGRCIFVARRSVETKFFSYPSNVVKPLYGRHLLPKNLISVLVCESIIDALTCWVYGEPAIALLGLGTANQLVLLQNLNVRRIVLALDADNEGIKSSLRIKKSLKRSGKIVTELDIPIGKDINNLSKCDFLKLQGLY